MKRIRQVNESRQLIYQAFKKLLENNDFNDITLSEIAEVAGVGRTTLYRHFKEKEDILLYQIENEMQKTFVKEFNYKNPTLLELFEFRLILIKDNPNIIILSKGDKLDALVKNSHINYKEHVKTLLSSKLDQYDIAFVNAGIDSITKLWVQNGMNTSCKEMALKCVELIECITLKL